MNPLPPINLCVTIFSGFLERLGSPNSGFVGLEHAVHQACCGRCDVRVRLHPWKVDVADVAEAAWRFRPENRPQVHLVAGYSYGGQAAVNFCGELLARGGSVVKELWLCDPVRRWKYLPGVAAGLGIGSLVIPRNVESVTWFRQRNPRWALGRGVGCIFDPAGHDVEAESPLNTTIRPPIERDAGHRYIDNDQAFRVGFVGMVASHLASMEARHEAA